MSLNYVERDEFSILNFLFFFSFLEYHHPKNKKIHFYSLFLLILPIISFVNLHSSDNRRHIGFVFLFIIPIPIFTGFYIPNSEKNINFGIAFLFFLPILPIIRIMGREDDIKAISLFLIFIPIITMLFRNNKEKNRTELVVFLLILPVLISRSHSLFGITKILKSDTLEEKSTPEKNRPSNCPNCGVFLEKEEIFCPACGNKIPH
ncbi:MAG: hypothetical protein HeimC3_09480 [Candidatus Heimdallarchaeota archaeon LC_3]|nr:MAG: hypothetical protein HeimC3_09480 [Candidatus Heimdallarchaeota archaeon LC_3]